MAPAANHGRRTPVQWGVRGALAMAALVVGYVATVHSAAQALPERALEKAHELAPGDARIAAALVRARLGVQLAERQARGQNGSGAVARIAEAERLAQMALRRDATAIPAVTTLGLVAQLRGDVRTARRLFRYSERLSRRDLVTQLWMIEDAVGRNDIPGALHHYDTALRTKWGSWDLLFPLLASASSDSAIEPELVKLLSTRPTWTASFVSYVANNSPNPVASAHFFVELRRAGVAVLPTAQAPVINALLAAKRRETAWAYYATVRRGADRRRSRDSHFTTMLEQASQLDWVPVAGDSGLSASIQRADQGGVFEFSAPPSIGGAVLQQVQLLPPGRYVLEGRSSEISQPKESRPNWVLTCIDGGKELGRLVVPNSAEGNGAFSGYFSVAADCPAQSLALIARASNALEGLSGRIEWVQLRPAP